MSAELLSPPQYPTPEQAARGPEQITPFERVRLGGDELAICGVVDLAPDGDGQVRLAVLDVGFRKNAEGKYGPYDIDGSGEQRTFEKPYVLVTKEHQGSENRTLTYEFDDEEPVTIGRESATAPSLGFDDNRYISRKHAQVNVDKRGKLTITDLESSNGTQVIRPDALLGETNTKFGYTMRISDFVHESGKRRPVSSEEAKGWGKGEFEGRPIIARDTPINTGVYPVGGAHGEALVVDDKKYPEELDQVYEKVTGALDRVLPNRLTLGGLRKKLLGSKQEQGSSGVELTKNVLSSVFDVVSKTLKYDLEATDALASDYQKIAMNVYIQEGVGVCRTQALLTAYVLERLVGEGRLKGRVSVDRNIDHAVAGGHAWSRFTDENGQVYIVDPAQQYVGTIEETYTKTNKWDYRRTEDLMKIVLGD